MWRQGGEEFGKVNRSAKSRIAMPTFGIPVPVAESIPVPVDESIPVPVEDPASQSGSRRKRRHITETERREIAAEQGWRCASCELILNAAFQVDHKQPLWALQLRLSSRSLQAATAVIS